MDIETVQERDFMGPHRGIQIKLIELHGTMGGAQWKIEREPFWMEVSPLMAVQARANYDAFCSKTKPKAVEGVSQFKEWAMHKFLATASIVMLFASPANAMTFLYSGALDSYTIQQSGTYSFTVAGAEGGTDDKHGIGGAGASLSGEIYFSAGTDLAILVGGCGYNGADTAGGGGGMSFISTSDFSPIIVAGGGGGAAWRYESVGGDAQTDSSFGDGQGGARQGSGAGWYSDGNMGFFDPAAYYSGGNGHSNPSFAGGDPNQTHVPIAGHSSMILVEPGGEGGFGGGGGGGYNTGGGGGGYSGGSPEMGGTSYFDAAAFNIVSSANRSLGYVELNYLGGISSFASLSAVPEPATWAMFLLGFGAIGYAMRRRNYCAG